MQTVRIEDKDAVSEKLTSFRDDAVDCLARKLKAQYGSEYKSYILQGAIQDTDCWCKAPETPRRNPNERESVREELGKKARTHGHMLTNSSYGREER